MTARASQASVSVLLEGDPPPCRVSQASVLVLGEQTSPALAAQVSILVLNRTLGRRTLAQVD